MLEDFVLLGARVGVNNHVTIGEGAQIAAPPAEVAGFQRPAPQPDICALARIPDRPCNRRKPR
jgi:hypothetical protein